MKNNFRVLKLTFLALGLVCYGVPPCVAAGQLNALGQLITKGSVAYVDNNPIPSGTTVLAGDKIRALNAPALISLSNGGRVELAPNTELRVAGEGQALQVTQTSGKSRFYVPKNVTLTLLTPKATVKTLLAAQSYSGILVVENNRVAFTSESGEFAVTDEGSQKTANVRDGQTTSVPEGTDQSSANKGSGTPSSTTSAGSSSGGGFAMSKAAWWTIGIVGGGSTAGLVAGIKASSGDETPIVSPSQP